jgi:hypothetical protein
MGSLSTLLLDRIIIHFTGEKALTHFNDTSWDFVTLRHVSKQGELNNMQEF